MKTTQLRSLKVFSFIILAFLSFSNRSFSQIDLSKPVGTTAGAASVSATGGVTYTIPIDVLKGTNGMEPKVTLSYNSQGSEGIAGFGWNLSAYSVISRQGKRQYYNGKNTPVTYTNDNDAFALDGQRLFPITGNNGDNGTVYGTENETFSKIESFGGSNTYGPDWFKVTTRDGMVMEYGTDYWSSKLLTDNWNSVMFWLLRRVTDKSGNYYEYTYSINQTDRNFALTEINYTGNANAGLQPYNKIEFTYSVLSNWANRKSFEGGASVISPFLLDQIHIKNDAGTTVKSYQCSYTTIKNQSFLLSFTETGSDGSVLNPLTFQYGYNTSSPDVAVSPSFSGYYVGNNNFTAEVTGDGRQDVISATFQYDNNNNRIYSNYSVLDQSTQGLSPYYLHSLNTNNGSLEMVNTATDYDGDGKHDLFMVSNEIPAGAQMFVGVKINYARKYNIWPPYQTVDYPQIPTDYYANYQYMYNQGTHIIAGDFDGDGAQDYILILGLTASNYFKAFFSSPAKNIINQEIISFGVGGNPSDPFYATTVASTPDILPMDFDGDGKTEILVQKSGASYVLSVSTLPASSGYNYGASVIYTFTNIISGYRVFPGDFNGDGKTDLLVRTSANQFYSPWNILYSTGTEYRSYPFYFQETPFLDGDYASNAHHVVVADFNHDGKTDIWHSLDNWNNTNSRHYLYFSNGVPLDYNNSTSAFSYETYYSNTSVNRYLFAQSVTGDFNLDGKPDIFSITGINGASTNVKFIYPRTGKEENLMTKSTNGLGADTYFSYTIGYNRSSVYDDDDPSAPVGQGVNGNPYSVLKTPMYVIQYLIEPNGLGWYNYTLMQYEDAMYHPLRGFLGFKKVEAYNYTTEIKSTTYSEMNTGFLLPQVYKTTTEHNSNLLSESPITNNLAAVNPGNYFDKRYVNQITNSKSFDYVNGSGTETSNTYDNYGNVTNANTSVGTFSGTTITPIETVATTTTYANGALLIPSLPATISVTKTRANQSSVTKTTAYGYFPNTSQLSFVTDWNGTALATMRYFLWDNFGNIVYTEIFQPNTPVFINTYDSKGRYLTSKKTWDWGSTAKTQTYTYNTLNDQVATATSSDGLTTTFTYDGFGRVTRTDLPDGNAIVNTIQWEQTDGRYSKTSYRYSDWGRWNKQYYDIINREVRKENRGFNNDLIVATTQYDYKGQVYKQVPPHYTYETAAEVTNTYDYLGRITSVSNGNTSANYSYSLGTGGLFTTTTTNGSNQATTKTTDASGKVVRSNDNGGQLDFTYDSWGNQLEAKFGSTSLIVNTYDNYGRQLTLTDKNAGTIAYEYNVLGKLTKQTDANNNITTSAYDAFGRVQSKTTSAGTTTYTYYNDPGTGHCNDNITYISGFAGDTKTYQYDNLQRLTQEITGITGQTFAKSFGYNGVGDLVSTSYSSGITINDTYNINGMLTQTSMTYNGNTQTLFTANALNSKGVYTSYTYGNGKTSTVDYDMVNGTPTRYYTQGVQDLNLSFDNNTGNLLSRYDAVKGLTETFNYDNLNRLTRATVNNVQQFSMTYDGTTNNSLGNIQSKSDIGNYRYDVQKINALRFLVNGNSPANPPNVITTNTQTLTYTPFLKTATLNENGYQLAYTYGEDEQRIKSVLTQNGSTIETKYYVGSYEKSIKYGNSQEIHYVSGGNGLCAIIVREGGINHIFPVYTDHLGSILSVSDVNGNVFWEQNFDAWGRNRNPTTWQYTNVPANPHQWMYRGYTGHEHLKEFALINMNGRMYDPVTCRMLSPDNYVATPFNTQGYNRYGYANNNPLIYTDPDGNFVYAAIIPILNAIGLGALIGGVQAEEQGKTFFSGAWKGAILGGVGYGANAITSSSFNSLGMVGGGIANGAITGIVTGGVNAALNGTNILNGALTGGLYGGVIGGVKGALERLSIGTSDFDLPEDQNTGEYFASDDELDKYIDDKIGNVSNIESRLHTDISLASEGNLPPGPYSFEDHLIHKETGHSIWVGGVTVPVTKTGWFNRLKSEIYISPGIKGLYYSGVNASQMAINHELLHAYHLSLGLPLSVFARYSERATSTYSLTYSKAYNMRSLIESYRGAAGTYPPNYNWRNLMGLLNLGIQ